MAASTILLAEDDAAIRELLRHHLRRDGLHVVEVADGLAALRAARVKADLVILDVGLPGLDGFEVTRTLRREHLDTPIMMLTARTEEIDRIVGFEIGADDYVCKPFSPHEVVARVKAILRRGGKAGKASARLVFGRLEIDEAAREARIDGCEVGLRPREFSLLLEFALNPGVVFSRERLLDRVWGLEFHGDERTVDVHVRRIRECLEEPFQLPQLIATIHGHGYKFAQQ
jgi:DNA-binding response OmpR family regulator